MESRYGEMVRCSGAGRMGFRLGSLDKLQVVLDGGQKASGGARE